MQIRKIDMEESILNCAKEEFLLHGYENSSMRTIARKANTSLGNIYHYYPNKKALLDCILKPKIYELCGFVREHTQTSVETIDMSQVEAYMDQIDFNMPQLQLLFSKEFVIFMETQEEEYKVLREEHLHLFKKHIAQHMNFENDDHHFVSIVTKMLVDSIIHMVKCSQCVKDKQTDLVNVFKMLCRSVAVNHLEEIDSKKE